MWGRFVKMKKEEKDDFQKEIAKTLKSIRKDVKETCNKIDSKVDETAKAVQKLSKIKFTKENITLWIALIALILNAVAVIITSCQLKQMSRKPELYLEARDIDTVNTTYNKINNKAMIFRCDLLNSGNEVARNIKITHSLYLDVDSTLSVRLTSQKGDDFGFFNRYGNEPGDTITNINPPSIVKFDTLYFPRIVGDSTKIDTHYFKRANSNTVSIDVSKYYKMISYGKDSSLKLHFIWLLRNVSTEIDMYYIPCTIKSDKGNFEDIITIENPFYKKGKQGE